jgi:hypothetical protein
LRPQRQLQWRWQPTAASVSAGNGGQSRGSKGQTTINLKGVAIAANSVLVAGETVAAVTVAAAMVMAATVTTTRQLNMARTVVEGVADVGGGHL